MTQTTNAPTWLDEAVQAASDAYRARQELTRQPLEAMSPERRAAWVDAVRAVDHLVGDRDMRVELPEAEDETPGYWQVRTALSTATHALQFVKIGSDDKLAAMATKVLAKVDEVLEGESLKAVTIEEHRWYAIVHVGGADGEVVKVIGYRGDSGISCYGSVAEWEAANS